MRRRRGGGSGEETVGLVDGGFDWGGGGGRSRRGRGGGGACDGSDERSYAVEELGSKGFRDLLDLDELVLSSGSRSRSGF